MTAYEITRYLARPFLPLLYAQAYRDIKRLVQDIPVPSAQILDVGGRKSPYTIGLNAAITVLDMPRITDIQERLYLGLTDNAIDAIRRRRSNIVDVILEDMTNCTLQSATFDGVVCVEVIEHVREADAFLSQVVRVLKPEGWLYITTPNGDYVRNEPPNYNPDHIIHYRRQELYELLRRFFVDVSVVYGIKTGKYRFRGLRPASGKHPVRLVVSMACNIISRIESRGLQDIPTRTAHLIAIAKKTKMGASG